MINYFKSKDGTLYKLEDFKKYLEDIIATKSSCVEYAKKINISETTLRKYLKLAAELLCDEETRNAFYDLLKHNKELAPAKGGHNGYGIPKVRNGNVG